jgi:hypothetical protein
MADMLAVVTGASSSIGLSLAQKPACRGYDLVICSCGDRLAEAAESIRSTGTTVVEVIADLSTRDGVELYRLHQCRIGVGRTILGDEPRRRVEGGRTKLCRYGPARKIHCAPDARPQWRKDAFTSSIAGKMVAPREDVYAATKALSLSAEKVETFGSNTGFGRPAQPIELAKIFVFLASDDASYLTGEVYGATEDEPLMSHEDPVGVSGVLVKSIGELQ